MELQGNEIEDIGLTINGETMMWVWNSEDKFMNVALIATENLRHNLPYLATQTLLSLPFSPLACQLDQSKSHFLTSKLNFTFSKTQKAAIFPRFKIVFQTPINPIALCVNPTVIQPDLIRSLTVVSPYAIQKIQAYHIDAVYYCTLVVTEPLAVTLPNIPKRLRSPFFEMATFVVFAGVVMHNTRRHLRRSIRA
ncbi:hypothetical protein L596_006788 [Steinernema carpocapsae]|uniref:Uncharacterized protein n=1 Tax=Steinernema carpocapsae TaxID=34508 RepID=A0A4U5P7V4_STECR|nr:hypothetical protein L596_006788 [Steinernema carpocapsae]